MLKRFNNIMFASWVVVISLFKSAKTLWNRLGKIDLWLEFL